MNTLNLKKSIKTLLGIAILGLAALTQSFTENARLEKTSKLAGEVWTNGDSNGNYTQLPTNETYNPINCQQTPTHACAYIRTDVPGTVPPDFDETEAEALEDAGLIEPIDDKTGVYLNN